MDGRTITLVTLLALVAPAALHAQVLRDLPSEIRGGRVELTSPTGNGSSSGASVEAALVNRTREVLRLAVHMVEPLFLRNGRSAAQNMIATALYLRNGGYQRDATGSFITLRPGERQPVLFIAYCADFEKENPSGSDSFQPDTAPPLVEAAARKIAAFQLREPERDITAADQVALWLAQGLTPAEIRTTFEFTSADEELARQILR